MSAWNVDSLNRSPDGWNELGVRRALQGDWWTARDCFERAVADRGDVVEFWANLGMASVRLHDEDTGRGAFEVSEVLACRRRNRDRPPCLAAEAFRVLPRGVVNE